MSDIPPDISLFNLTLNSANENVYGAGSFNGSKTTKIKLNHSETSNISNLSYEWLVTCEPIEEDEVKKFAISAELTSRYSFKDKQYLEIVLENEGENFVSKNIVFNLDKGSEKQQFEIIYQQAWGVPFDEIEVFAVMSVEQIRYYSSDWATEYNFQDSKRAHDVVLVVGDTKFYVIRSYLATWSRYFDRLFFGVFKENAQYEIRLEEVNAEEFNDILHYIHPQMHWKLGESQVINVLKLADRFDIPNLMVRCGTILSDFEKCKKVELIERLELADTHNLVHLQIACFKQIHSMSDAARTEFIEKNRRRMHQLSENTIKNLI